jgi:Txe/YoeB family toxin of Txe-Axe toxin-antitoxin module
MHDVDHSKEVTLTDVQLQIEVFERKVEGLKRLHGKAMQQRAKNLSIAYLKKMGTQTQEAISLPVARNVRGQYGHEKAQSPVCSSSAPASSTDATPVVIEAPKNHVVIKLHKDAQKQYETLLKLRGMEGKYDTFISEIMENPLQIEGTSGRTELLKGETSLFSRRFDSGNRFVYHVNKTEDGTYEVLILSLLGHYKNLGHQVKVMHKN